MGAQRMGPIQTSYSTTSTQSSGISTMAAPGPSEGDITAACAQLYDMWAKANHAKALCLAPDDKLAIGEICMAVHHAKTMTMEAGLAAMNLVIAEACAMAGDGNGNGDGDTPLTLPVEEPSAMRTWGPIVGLGLLAAIALTAMRKRKRK